MLAMASIHEIDPSSSFPSVGFVIPSSMPPMMSPEPTQIPSIHLIHDQVGSLGYTTLWIMLALMLLSCIWFTYLASRVPMHKRLFHIICVITAVISAVSYFAMASGDGYSFVADGEHTSFRQVSWALYIYWFITTPLTVLLLGFLAGLDGASIISSIVADEVMILLGMFAAFSEEALQKWGYYTLSGLGYFALVYILAVPGRRAADSKGEIISNLYTAIGSFVLVLFTLYGAIWTLGGGVRIWSVDAEIVGYAILDILAIPLFGTWILLTYGKHAEGVGGFWTQGLKYDNTIN